MFSNTNRHKVTNILASHKIFVEKGTFQVPFVKKDKGCVL